MKKVLEFLKVVKNIIIAVVIGIFAGIIIGKKNQNEKDAAEKAKKETKDELEKKSADDIAADSDSADTIRTNINKEQEEFRQRVRDRLKQNVQRFGSSSNN